MKDILKFLIGSTKARLAVAGIVVWVAGLAGVDFDPAGVAAVLAAIAAGLGIVVPVFEALAVKGAGYAMGVPAIRAQVELQLLGQVPSEVLEFELKRRSMAGAIGRAIDGGDDNMTS